MRPSSLANAALIGILGCVTTGCGRKGDPLPRPWAEPQAPRASFADLRTLEVVLPSRDARGAELRGLDQVRVLWLQLGSARPTADEVAARGEVVLEARRPDLPAPGGVLRLSLKELERPAGWLVVIAVRGGNVPSPPSAPLPWLDPAL
jgi:hypothetical protein